MKADDSYFDRIPSKMKPGIVIGLSILILSLLTINYRRGDSVFVDCNIGIARIYRNKKLLSENELIRSIKGRPF